MGADFTKAGKDRGDIEAELKNMIISAKVNISAYLTNIEDLTKEELESDLTEYTNQLSRYIIPIVKRAESTGDVKLIKMAHELRELHENLMNQIKERIKALP
ncbi:hypothetical protein [Sulfurihydrogenibium sp.]|uniref:hypothetical protein n=1 Tax=Sulfurihydrogenibium sp. TaxID=2053621 RepID=UPI0026141B26|nr:hypothetical protein [Sulfurihydrogenibium sp.]